MNDLRGFGGGGKGSDDGSTGNETPDSLRNGSYAKVLDLVSEGPVGGLKNGGRSIFLNETPYLNADGTANFAGFQYQVRTGTQDQSYIPGFPDVENEVTVGSELVSDTPWTRAITNRQLSAVRIRLSVPSLMQTDASGNTNGYRVEYAIDLSTDGSSFSQVDSGAFDGKTTSKYVRSLRIELPRSVVSGWQIRVRRLTANAHSIRIQDVTTIESYTEIVDAKLRYPMSAIVGIVVDASQFQGIPTRAYEMYGRIIRVPSNYDPIERTYDGIWDGTFKPAWTDSPPWIFYDLALNERYGLGNVIGESQLDKWTLYRIAQYCDELVPDGKGGQEPRFTCNVYLQERAQAYKVLQDLASVFRGIVYWGGGQIVPCADMPTDPVYTYTAANVIGGKFTSTGSSRKTRYTVALVSWNDPTDFYRAKVEYVEDEEGIARYGVRQLEITAFGCTSQGQAQRAGRWAIQTSILEAGVETWQVGLEGVMAGPGQIVRVADPKKMGRRNAGRIRSASGRTVTVDKAPVVAVGDAFTVILPSAVSETRVVEAVSGTDITVVSEFSEPPQAQSIWSVDNIDLVVPLYRIASVTEKDKLIFEIAGSRHEPGKFAFIDSETKIAKRPTSVVPMRYQAPPSNLRLSTYNTSTPAGTQTTLVIAWDAPDKGVQYLPEWRRNSGEWVPLPKTGSLSAEVPGIYAGSYMARVRAYNSIDIPSIAVTTDPTTLDGNSGPPSDVPWFFIDGDILSWGSITDAELAGYVIRYHYGQNTSWGDANPLHTGILLSSPYPALNRPSGQITLMIKAINKAGTFSASPAIILSAFGDALVANVVEDFDFQAMGFPGNLTGAQVVGDELHAIGTGELYRSDAADFFATDGTAKFYSDNYQSMGYETIVFTPSVVASGIKMTLDLDMQGSTKLIEYRISGGERFFSTDDTITFFGGDLAPFYGADAVYQNWPGSVIVQPVQYQFRFTTGQGPAEGIIGTCRAVIDVPDIEEKLNDIAISAAGTRLPLSKSYLAVKNVQLTLQANGGTAASVKYLDKNNTIGPLVQCFNLVGASVAGVVDASIQGY